MVFAASPVLANTTRKTGMPKAHASHLTDPHGARGAAPVSIGLPVRNGEPHLVAALDSLLSQDFVDFELVASDNASADATPDILHDYASRDPRLRWVRQRENIGGPENFNVVFHLSRAPLFKWAASNDLHHQSHLSTCVEALADNSQAVLAYTKTFLIDEDGCDIGPHEDGLDLRQRSAAERLQRFVYDRRLCNALYGVMRRDALTRTSLNQPYVSSDITLLAELAVQGQFVEAARPFFFRRITAQSQLSGVDVDELVDQYTATAVRDVVPHNVRIMLDVNRAIARAEHLSAGHKAQAASSFSTAWVRKRFVRPARRRIRGERSPTFSEYAATQVATGQSRPTEPSSRSTDHPGAAT